MTERGLRITQHTGRCMRSTPMIVASTLAMLIVLAGVLVTWTSGSLAAEKVTLTYAYWGLPSVEQNVVDLFQSEYPEISIDIFQVAGGTGGSAEKLLVMAASQSLPDMFALSGTQGYPATFMKAGYLLDLTPFMNRDNIKPELFVPNAWNYAVREGRVMGWPRATYGISLGTAVIAYNRELYRSAGLDYPRPGWTFADYLGNAQKLTCDLTGSGTPTQWGTNLLKRSWWQVWVWSNGGEILSGDMSRLRLLESPAVDGLQWMADLIHVHRVSPEKSVQFLEGKAAMDQVTTAVYRDWAGYADLDYSLIGPPRGPSGQTGYSIGGSNIIGVSAFTRHPEEVWLFLKFLAQKRVHEREVFEWQTATPNLRSVALSDRFLLSDKPPYDLRPIVYENPSKPTPQHPNWPELNTLVQNILRDEVLSGRTSARAAFTAAESRMKAAFGL